MEPGAGAKHAWCAVRAGDPAHLLDPALRTREIDSRAPEPNLARLSDTTDHRDEIMTEPMLEGTGCALQEPFALQVLGPDMEPELPDKCIVIIEPTEVRRSGTYVFAEVEGVRWLRQYKRDSEGREWLLALNPAFPEIEVTRLDWKVLGVVIQRNIRRNIKHYDYADTGEPAAESRAIDAVDITGTA